MRPPPLPCCPLHHTSYNICTLPVSSFPSSLPRPDARLVGIAFESHSFGITFVSTQEYVLGPSCLQHRRPSQWSSRLFPSSRCQPRPGSFCPRSFFHRSCREARCQDGQPTSSRRKT